MPGGGWSPCAALLLAPLSCGARELLQVFVTAPYLELHTGPGRGYPVFHVVPRDGAIDVVKRRTDWFKVRDERGVEGWAAQRDMLQTVLADGSPFTFSLGDRAGLHLASLGTRRLRRRLQRRLADLHLWLLLFQLADLAAELSVGQFLGNASNGYVADLGLTHVFAAGVAAARRS